MVSFHANSIQPLAPSASIKTIPLFNTGLLFRCLYSALLQFKRKFRTKRLSQHYSPHCSSSITTTPPWLLSASTQLLLKKISGKKHLCVTHNAMGCMSDLTRCYKSSNHIANEIKRDVNDRAPVSALSSYWFILSTSTWKLLISLLATYKSSNVLLCCNSAVWHSVTVNCLTELLIYMENRIH